MRESVAAFANLARHLPVVVLGPDATVLAATEAAARALGSRPEELAGAAWPALCADPPERTRDLLELCARTLSPIPGAFHRAIDGRHLRFRCDGHAVPLAGGRVIVLEVRRQDERDRFILLAQKAEELHAEIIRRRHSERQLAQERARLTAILDQMPAGVVIAAAPSGEVTYANGAARAIFGGDIAADRAANYDKAFTAWDGDGRELSSHEYPLVRALGGEIVTGQEVRFRRPDGATAVVRANAAPIRDERGAIVAAVTAYYDITAQKELEKATEAARVQAETASRAKDEFLAMLGHELRNPLAPILTALQLMQLRDVGADKERTIIERQVRHMVGLVDDLLDISRVTAGKIQLKRERVELGAVVARALELVSPLLERREHRLSLAVAPHGLVVDGDVGRLAQIVSNLLNNAAKYSEPGSQIWVTARRDDGALVLRVRDEGIGIAPEMLPRLFDRFVQEKQALDRSQGGLGLGLAIARSLVELHGGTITVESGGAGTGSVFIVRLPAAAGPADAAAQPTAGERRTSGDAGGARVLIVDDNEDGAEMLAETLLTLGHVTRVAHDGPGALRIASEFAPELAMLDIGLPVMDGYELAQRLREQAGQRPLRLVAITGYGQDHDRARAREAGFDAHVVKPVDIDRLLALVGTLLARGSR